MTRNVDLILIQLAQVSKIFDRYVIPLEHIHVYPSSLCLTFKKKLYLVSTEAYLAIVAPLIESTGIPRPISRRPRVQQYGDVTLLFMNYIFFSLIKVLFLCVVFFFKEYQCTDMNDTSDFIFRMIYACFPPLVTPRHVTDMNLYYTLNTF